MQLRLLIMSLQFKLHQIPRLMICSYSLWIRINGQEELHVTRVTTGNTIVLAHPPVLLKMALTVIHSNMDQVGQNMFILEVDMILPLSCSIPK